MKTFKNPKPRFKYKDGHGSVVEHPLGMQEVLNSIYRISA